jgi:hypothetical protein
MKMHNHSEQFDGVPHSVCGRGTNAVSSKVFESIESELRCKLCERDWFPNGQPEWHLRASQKSLGVL